MPPAALYAAVDSVFVNRDLHTASKLAVDHATHAAKSLNVCYQLGEAAYNPEILLPVIKLVFATGPTATATPIDILVLDKALPACMASKGLLRVKGEADELAFAMESTPEPSGLRWPIFRLPRVLGACTGPVVSVHLAAPVTGTELPAAALAALLRLPSLGLLHLSGYTLGGSLVAPEVAARVFHAPRAPTLDKAWKQATPLLELSCGPHLIELRLDRCNGAPLVVVASPPPIAVAHTSRPLTIGFAQCNEMTHVKVEVTRPVQVRITRCLGLQRLLYPSVDMPHLPEKAAYACPALLWVELPMSLRVVGERALSKCPSLVAVHLPPTAFKICNRAFAGCSALSSVPLPPGMASIGTEAFWGTGVTSVRLPAALVHLGDGAYGGCSNLTVAHLGETRLRQIPSQAFLGCAQLATAVLPLDLQSIERGAFSGCQLTGHFNSPALLYRLGSRAFQDCLFTEVTLGDAVQEVGEFAFHNCPFLKTVNMQRAGVHTLENSTFEMCIRLTRAYLPLRLLCIRDRVFATCLSLSACDMETKTPELTDIRRAAFRGTALTSVTLPASLLCLGQDAFAQCMHLIKLDIRGLSGAIEIGSAPFRGCHILEVALPDEFANFPLVSLAEWGFRLPIAAKHNHTGDTGRWFESTVHRQPEQSPWFPIGYEEL
jgi:hypothetical protein